MSEKTVMIADNYDRIDGRNAYRSETKRMTLGMAAQKENEKLQIVAKIFKESEGGGLQMETELPIHQVFDLMIFLGRSLLHFREAYKLPLLYDPQKPVIERIGIQGDAMPVAVCTENQSIGEDIKAFSQALSDSGEMTGERLRILRRILEELEYC